MNMQVLGNHKAHFDLSPCLTLWRIHIHYSEVSNKPLECRKMEHLEVILTKTIIKPQRHKIFPPIG